MLITEFRRRQDIRQDRLGYERAFTALDLLSRIGLGFLCSVKEVLRALFMDDIENRAANDAKDHK